MGSILLNAVWIGSWKSSRAEAEQIHAKVLLYAEESRLGDLVSNVSASANGLTQFMIMPCSSKEGYPDNVSWENTVTYAASLCAGTDFFIKRLYVASN
jgi:hypothetical protein